MQQRATALAAIEAYKTKLKESGQQVIDLEPDVCEVLLESVQGQAKKARLAEGAGGGLAAGANAAGAAAAGATAAAGAASGT